MPRIEGERSPATRDHFGRLLRRSENPPGGPGALHSFQDRVRIPERLRMDGR